ncbi:unnamed protein product [Heligmosomoides polygyrus]|uniref:CACTA en-spm transposon protein n=1 Tax=Heligmosomoides polygyrus TaxID=6339 RepID=A0A183F4W3_HELPZ|nr:unnamed protein product [Heligmosomoides polygyrus]
MVGTELDAFYEKLEEVISNEMSAFYRFVVADFNAKVGVAPKRSTVSEDLDAENGTKTAIVSLSFVPFFMETQREGTFSVDMGITLWYDSTTYLQPKVEPSWIP